ncbi:hypothetical protein [Leptospirillum ferriphilum]|uniref:hypothetical protein n=1 Tax=Leptospirillum ferriphilum TaxID=178606 RepID=UPI001179BF9A|nr:hypothetical protein [Leptospirillum ferriphilum]
MKTDVWEEFRTPADLAPWKIHVVTELFPPMTKEDYSRLKEDIRKNGQRVPILLWNGMVVDGLNRLMVCRELKIKPVFQEWDGVGSLVDLVVSMNMSRRAYEPIPDGDGDSQNSGIRKGGVAGKTVVGTEEGTREAISVRTK